ncbi:MAG: DUF3501 family protein [Actinomycetota bacterium]|nr:DUF3501 family protein [Actinomycetota bacterium]
MKPVRREELYDHVTWAERRAAELPGILAAKAARRIHVGEHLTFLFENRETIRYQVLEMLRVERIVREADVLHELATYNELLGGPGELGCTLLVEIDDPVLRAQKLVLWGDLPEHAYVGLEDGTRVRPRTDDRQRTEGRLSSVQYLKFATGGRVPVTVGCDHPDQEGETRLSSEQRAAFAEDLG